MLVFHSQSRPCVGTSGNGPPLAPGAYRSDPTGWPQELVRCSESSRLPVFSAKAKLAHLQPIAGRVAQPHLPGPRRYGDQVILVEQVLVDFPLRLVLGFLPFARAGAALELLLPQLGFVAFDQQRRPVQHRQHVDAHLVFSANGPLTARVLASLFLEGLISRPLGGTVAATTAAGSS